MFGITDLRHSGPESYWSYEVLPKFIEAGKRRIIAHTN